MKTFHLRQSTPKSPCSAPWPGVGLCVNCHPLEEEASLMRTDQCTDLWLCHYAIRSHFIPMFLYQNNTSQVLPRRMN